MVVMTVIAMGGNQTSDSRRKKEEKQEKFNKEIENLL